MQLAANLPTWGRTGSPAASNRERKANTEQAGPQDVLWTLRRRRRASHELLHGDHDRYGSGSGNPPDRERRV
jgi:hypothetical protein